MDDHHSGYITILTPHLPPPKNTPHKISFKKIKIKKPNTFDDPKTPNKVWEGNVWYLLLLPTYLPERYLG
jgi:hypothetical protein